MVLLMSEGRTRALDERCLTFLEKYAKNYIIIDFKELNAGRIDPEIAEFFNPVVMIPVERYYVAQMAEVRGHSMDDRRYMWKVEY
jgi:fructoselysine 6-phosphate deglycase